MTRTLICALLAAAFAAESLAQTAPATPTDSQLAQERGRIEAQRKLMFDAANPATRQRTGKVPGSPGVNREMSKIDGERKAMFDQNNPATKGAANSFPDIATPERSKIDLEALAQRYEQKAGARKTDGLMVFASFSMPGASLKRLIADATRAGGAVVLRGFKDGSVKSTALAVNALGQAAGNVQINPNAFIKYRITAVPAIVLVKPEGAELVDNEGCALPDKYAMVAGDVGLSYALEDIGRRAPQFQEMAERYGRPLKGSAR